MKTTEKAAALCHAIEISETSPRTANISLMASEVFRDVEKLEKERDVLLQIEGTAQKRYEELERVLRLLTVAGFVTEEKVTQARELAGSK